jgi:hypothetical protein
VDRARQTDADPLVPSIAENLGDGGSRADRTGYAKACKLGLPDFYEVDTLTFMMHDRPICVRLDGPTLKRLDKLVTVLQQGPLGVLGKMSRSKVLRLVVDGGLRVLEADPDPRLRKSGKAKS